VSFLRNQRFLLACRLGLAALFLYAAHDKILAPAAFAKIVYQWQVGGAVFSNLVAVVLPWVEVVVGLLLLFGVWTKEAALVVAALLLAFNLAAVSVLARGIDVENCGCTSVKASAAPSPFHGVGWFLLTRNSFLLVAALAVAFAPSPAPAEGEVGLPAQAPATAP
jgi:uncharacterized membrane protein YphA (DoxX/SURF4 family)